MASKVFIDANILLDFTLKRANYEDARKIIELTVSGNIQAYISPAIVHITGYWLTKAYGDLKAKEILLTLMADIQVIDIGHETTIAALHSKINDIEDALQYYTAMHHKIAYFISEDKNLARQSLAILPVYTSKEFLKRFI